MAELSYPLSRADDGSVTARSGRPVRDVTLAAVVAGEVTSDDVAIGRDALLAQAAIAEADGRRQLAENLRRGAELTAFDDDQLLAFYEALRPGRSTAAELEALAVTLVERGADGCAVLVREAAAAYARRGIDAAEPARTVAADDARDER